ncbi:MAG: hypothetical protein MMC23_006041 [Stictis urceolatum]|nr:hypothetical protein [Stictis urceolata]
MAVSVMPAPIPNQESKTIIEGANNSKVHQGQAINSINELLVNRAVTIPDKPLLAYPTNGHDSGNYLEYTANDLDCFADEAAKRYTVLGLSPKPLTAESEVVAVLGPSNVDYIITTFALTRMGFSVLFLSTRLPTEAYMSLLQKTKCSNIIASPQFSAAVDRIQDTYEITKFLILDETVYRRSNDGDTRFARKWEILDEADRIAFIVHSSGSTGLPKPIFQTHRSCLANYSVGSGMRAIVTLPLYHNHGLATFFRGIHSGVTTAFFNAGLPLTHDNLVNAMEQLGVESFHGVPYALKLLAESDRGMQALRSCKLVLFGGSSCPDELGDKLVDAGVYLVGHYGATEMGQLMTSFREPTSKEWDYLRPFAKVAPYLRFEPISEGIYECIVLDGLPTKVMFNSDDPPNSFHTHDTFIPHATIPNAWKYLGRLDDRVTLVNGEKVLPLPFEHRVRQSRLVEEALIFGVAMAFPGLLIFPSERARDFSKAQILEQITPLVEAANEHAEKFSRISMDMVEVLDTGTQYPRTDKGTVIRAAAYKVFEDVIASVYKRFETYDESRDGERRALDLDELQTYLLDLFESKVGISSIAFETDFFDAGMDSLQTLTARARIVRDLDLGGSIPSHNVVFEHSNINKLATHLYCLRTGETIQRDDEIELMRELINKYSVFPKFTSGTSKAEGETILLTGTTGSLGAHILSQLANLPLVRSIYCLVRASSAEAAQSRVFDSLKSRHIFSSAVATKAICLPSDFSSPTLGLDIASFDALRSTLTTVIHSAWAVNFNIGVGSFEKQHIAGAHHLLNLCLQVPFEQPARLFFVSSISAAAGTPMPAAIREGHVESLAHAQKMGYARSKLVTEHIIRNAARQTGMHAQVLRSGQLVGDSEHGLWNPTEAIPLMIQSATTIGALPSLDETPSWLPIDKCAAAMVELAGVNAVSGEGAKEFDSETVYHVQNTKLFSWTEELLPALREAGLEFKTVPQKEWVRRLRDGEQDPVKNPTVKLLDFFTEKYDHGGVGRKGLVFETEKTGRDSETIRSGFDVVGSWLLSRCLDSWREAWGRQ